MSYGQLSVYAVVGGGLIHYRFRNIDNGRSKDYAVAVWGFGAGVSAPRPSIATALTVWSMTGDQLLNAFVQSRSRTPYAPLNCARAFSFHDLNYSFMETASGYGGLMVGMSLGALQIRRYNIPSEYLVRATGSLGPAVGLLPSAYAAMGYLLPIERWGRDFDRLGGAVMGAISSASRREGTGRDFHPTRSTL